MKTKGGEGGYMREGILQPERIERKKKKKKFIFYMILTSQNKP